MTIESALAKAIEGGDHPGLFSETESYTSPRVVARNELIRLFTQDHLKEALRRYRELRAEQPKVIDEDLTRVLGRYLGNHGRLDAAIAVCKENAQNYPIVSEGCGLTDIGLCPLGKPVPCHPDGQVGA